MPRRILTAYERVAAWYEAAEAPKKIYRGIRLTNLPPEMLEKIRRLQEPPMDESEVGQHLQIGPMLLDHIQNTPWKPFSATPDELAYTGAGRHWTRRRDFAEMAASNQIGPGISVIMEADDPGEDYYDPELPMTGKRPDGTGWEDEEEATLLPNTPLNFTSIRLPKKWLFPEVLDDPYYHNMEQEYGHPYPGGPRQGIGGVTKDPFGKKQASRTAMPAVDAYDTRYRPEERHPYPVVPNGPWYHGSDHDLSDGTELVPGGGKSKWTDIYEGDWEERPNWVWFSDDPDEAQAWGKNVYLINPTEDGPHRWNGQAYNNDYVSQRARVIRKLNPDEFEAIPRRTASYYDPMGEQDWNEIYGDLPDHVHRGIGVNLPDDLHRMVHDPAIPAEQRAQALLQHLTSPEARVSPWGNDWREGLGTSWSGDDSVAEDFARQSASQLTDYNQSQAGPNQDFTWGTDEDGDPVGKPGTAVMLRALRPELDEIDDDPNGDGSGMRYTYHGHGEQEVPVRGGSSMNIRGISWRPILPMFHPDYLTDPEEYTTHDFADDNWRTASRHRTAALAEDFVNKLRDEFVKWHGKSDYGLRYWENIEQFLADKYPEASRNFGFGLEEARPLLRNEEMFYGRDLYDDETLTPYKTGPDIEAQLGYDPRNVAAGMVYLHNNANNINRPGSRDAELMEDEDLLYNIFSQRQKMQDEYNKKKSQQPEQLTLFSHRAAPVEGPR